MMYGYSEGMAGVLDYDWSKWPEGKDKFKLTAMRPNPPLTDSVKEIGAKYADRILLSRNPQAKIKAFMETYVVDGEMVSGTPERFAVYYAINHRKAAAAKTAAAKGAGRSITPGVVPPSGPADLETAAEAATGGGGKPSGGGGMLAIVGAAVALFALSRS